MLTSLAIGIMRSRTQTSDMIKQQSPSAVSSSSQRDAGQWNNKNARYREVELLI